MVEVSSSWPHKPNLYVYIAPLAHTTFQDTSSSESCHTLSRDMLLQRHPSRGNLKTRLAS